MLQTLHCLGNAPLTISVPPNCFADTSATCSKDLVAVLYGAAHTTEIAGDTTDAGADGGGF